MYNFTMFFIKMTFLCQYYRIFSHMRAMRVTYLVAMVAIGGWCFAQVVAVGCDVPKGAHVMRGSIVPSQVVAPKVECFAPVTTVAVTATR